MTHIHVAPKSLGGAIISLSTEARVSICQEKEFWMGKKMCPAQGREDFPQCVSLPAFLADCFYKVLAFVSLRGVLISGVAFMKGCR